MTQLTTPNRAALEAELAQLKANPVVGFGVRAERYRLRVKLIERKLGIR